MNRLALGTAQFGSSYGIANQFGQVTSIEAEAMLNLALNKDINMLDTAICYGQSETFLGDIGIDSFKIITKLPGLPDNCTDICKWVNSQIDAALLRLGVTSIYGVLLHQPDQLLGANGKLLYQALQVLKENGKAQKVGISIYSPNELAELLQSYRFDLVQAPFNLVDQRLFSSGWIYRMKDYGIELHTRSVFLQGLLLMSKINIPNKFSPWNSLWNQWHGWLADRKISALQASLAFPLSFAEIDRVIVGAENAYQLEQIVDAASKKSIDFLPNLSCEDENLVNPVNWNLL